ncbi:unnamed protein product [Fraxinus pennsylvanica]|uniref:Ionotropic glutamate receptor C-terminal domain-containing protein n=1 Tax=Fraxinus pennsylvanica TaxID=56036 RepID=A0AAD2EDN3_9LAMI|nr:unnamed protein product [Fraxinus pennsylvanica]
MDMAIQDFNMQHNQTFLMLRLKCSKRKPLQSALAARHLINKNNVELIIGPRSWEETSTVAEVGELYDVPILSFSDSSPPWAAERWPFLIQAAAGTHVQMKAVANIIQSWGWRRVNVIYEDTDSAANGISPYLYGAFQAVDVEISNFLPLSSFAESSLLHNELENLKQEQCRVFVVHTSFKLATRIFGMAKEKRMMEKEYVWITTDSITSSVHSVNFSLISSMQGEKLHSNLSRVATVVWLFVALIITQSYTASLSSMLTVQNLKPKIANIETLKSNNALIGYSQMSFVRGYLEGPLGFKSNNIRNFTSTDEYAHALRNGTIAAAFLEAPVAKLFVAKYCKSFVIAGPTYQVGGYGFAFPKGSLILPDIDEALLNVRENGVLKDLEQRLIASEQCEDIPSDNETASLSPQSFFVLFIITGVTSSTSLLIYYFRAKDRYENSMAQYKGIWIAIMMVLNKLGHHKNRLSRKVSDVADENPENSPNNLHSRLQA